MIWVIRSRRWIWKTTSERTVMDHWIKRTHSERSELVKDSISEFHESRLGVTRISIWGLASCEITKRSGPSDHQEWGPLIWAPSRSLTYHDLEWQESPSKDQRDVRTWKDQDLQISKNEDRWYELHLGVLPIVTWSDENLHLRNSEMRDREKIRTVGSPRTWTIDLSSILEFSLSWLGVTRTSILGTMICKIMI